MVYPLPVQVHLQLLLFVFLKLPEHLLNIVNSLPRFGHGGGELVLQRNDFGLQLFDLFLQLAVRDYEVVLDSDHIVVVFSLPFKLVLRVLPVSVIYAGIFLDLLYFCLGFGLHLLLLIVKQLIHVGLAHLQGLNL